MHNVDLKEWLNSLGKSSQEIANTLKKQGIKGKPKNSCGCPIYKSLVSFISQTRNVEDIVDLVVTYHWINLIGDKHKGEALSITILTPPHLATFINEFDNGKYPELIGDSEEVTILGVKT